MTFDALESLGLKNINKIERYTLRSETNLDILKIYYHKEKGSLFQHSEKFKFQRVRRAVPSHDQSGDYNTEFSEISPMLIKIMVELDNIVTIEKTERNLKEKILADLNHLEKVVSNKISEIEADLKKL